MVGSNEEKVTRFDLPSFKIIVNNGLGLVSRSPERLEIAFQFSSDSDRKEVIKFLEARTNHDSEQYPKINFDSSDENVLVFHGENAKHLAKLLLEDVHFTLPIDEFCEFGAAFENIPRLEERLAELKNSGRALRELAQILNFTDVELTNDPDIEDKRELSDNASFIDHIRAVDQKNKTLFQNIKKDYAAIEQQIADRNKITTTIRDFCNFMVSLVKKKETQMPGHSVNEVENKVAEITLPETGSYISADKLAKCTPEELECNINNLIERFNDHKTAEEKAAKLVKWVAKNCKEAYEYTLVKSKPAVTVIIRAVASVSSSVLAAGRGFFASRESTSNDNSNPENESKTGGPPYT